MSHLTTIIRKEWAEVFQDRIVFWTTVTTPLVFVLLAGGTVWSAAAAVGQTRLGAEEQQELLALGGAQCTGLQAADCLGVYMGSMFLVLFLMLPMLLPSIFAAYSVVGEKTNRTLEPLLATPVTTGELLAGKAIAAIIPGLGASWLGTALYLGGCAAYLPAAAMSRLLTPAWIAALLVMAPLLSLFATLAALLVSSRVSDPRAAQQISGLVVLPLVGVMTGQSVGFILVGPALVASFIAVLAAMCAAMLWLAIRLFEREAILTRWR